jgi:hypothetical protein
MKCHVHIFFLVLLISSINSSAQSYEKRVVQPDKEITYTGKKLTIKF